MDDRFVVEGDSMLPLLRPGDVVKVQKTGAVKPGDIVVARHPIQTDLIIIKRVEAVQGGKITLKGLNPGASSDSRAFGPVRKKHLIGRVMG